MYKFLLWLGEGLDSDKGFLLFTIIIVVIGTVIGLGLSNITELNEALHVNCNHQYGEGLE